MRQPGLNRLNAYFDDLPLSFITFCTEQRHPLLANPIIHASRFHNSHGRATAAMDRRYKIPPSPTSARCLLASSVLRAELPGLYFTPTHCIPKWIHNGSVTSAAAEVAKITCKATGTSPQ